MALSRERQAFKTLSDLLNDAEYSDLTIKCKHRVFHVHKAIVCRASPALKAAIQHGFKETISSTIEHTEFDPDTVERMISYMYTADYKVSDFDDEADIVMATPDSTKRKRKLEMALTPSHTSNAVSQATGNFSANSIATESDGSVNRSLVAHARVFGLGDYYDIPALRDLALKKFFSTGANPSWSIEGFINVVKEVDRFSQGSNRHLHYALVAIASSRKHALANDPSFMESLRADGNAQIFAADMFRHVTGLLERNESDVPVVGSSKKKLKGDLQLSTEPLLRSRWRDLAMSRIERSSN